MRVLLLQARWEAAVDSFMTLAHTRGQGYDNPTALCELILDKLQVGLTLTLTRVLTSTFT